MKNLTAIFILSLLAKLSFSQSPVADFKVEIILSDCPPYLVQFTDMSFGSIESWYWDFGNGFASADKNPSNTYSLPGSYTITLIVIDSAGLADTLVRADYIKFTAPYAEFSQHVESNCSPLEVEFTIDTSSHLGGYIWVFGDGNSLQVSDTVTSISYIYQTPGSYTPILLIWNPVDTTFGRDDSCSLHLTGNEILVAGPNVNLTATAGLCGIPQEIKFGLESIDTIPASAIYL